MRKIVLGLALLGLAAPAALAQTPTTFATVDADADTSGGLSAAEIDSLQPSAVPAPAADPAAPAAPLSPAPSN
ncbi:MAG: hypothetical protein B7Z15_18520 [Rhizobiales bacterium 32-66-8]|nr:MAG: hypothetical protein B7Z15_18520 [Rhizobiales bacterium 32-66-8]